VGSEKGEIQRNFFHHSNILIVNKSMRLKNVTDGSRLDEQKSG
jgi:hypothetical protein